MWHFEDTRFVFPFFAIVVVVCGGVAIHWVPEIVAIYPSMVGAISTISGLFLAGDVMGQHLHNKLAAQEGAQAGLDSAQEGIHDTAMAAERDAADKEDSLPPHPG